MNCIVRWVCAGMVSMILAPGALAVTIDMGTAGNAATWSVTGAGAIAAPAFQVAANGSGEISLTSNGFRNGTFVAGGSLAAFDGFWYADKTFVLPAACAFPETAGSVGVGRRAG